MRSLACSLLVLSAIWSPLSLEGSALADDAYEVVSGSKGRIDVRQGKRRATLIAEESTLGDVKVNRRAKTVTISRTTECHGVPPDETMSFDQLEARLVNGEALALHRKKDFTGSAKGFEAATKLDPKWITSAYNLACARTQLGDLTAAAAAIAPWLRSAPVPTYLHVASDAELRPLLDSPALTALNAAKPGTVKLGPKAGGTIYAWAPERKLVASVFSMLRRPSCATSTSIAIYDATTGHEVATATVEEPGECGKGDPAAALHTAVAERVLVALGFSPTAEEPGTRLPQGDDGRETVRFKQSRLGVLVIGGGVNILRGDKSVGKASIYERFHGASYLPEPHVMFLDSFWPSDMCEAARTDVVPIKD